MALICAVSVGFVGCDKDDESVSGYEISISDISTYDYPSESVWSIVDESISTSELESFVNKLKTIYENAPETRISLVFANLESLSGTSGIISYCANDFSGCNILTSVTFSKLSSGSVNFRNCDNLTVLSFPYHNGGYVFHDESLTKITCGTFASGAMPLNPNSSDDTGSTIAGYGTQLAALDEQYTKEALKGNTGSCADLMDEIEDLEKTLESALKSASSITTLVTKKNSSYSILKCDNCSILYSSSGTSRMTSCSVFKEIIYQ